VGTLSGQLQPGGAISGGWSTLPLATPVESCEFVNGLAVGPGGLWLSEGVTSPTLTPKSLQPALPPQVKRRPKKKCGKGKDKRKRSASSAKQKKRKKCKRRKK